MHPALYIPHHAVAMSAPYPRLESIYGQPYIPNTNYGSRVALPGVFFSYKLLLGMFARAPGMVDTQLMRLRSSVKAEAVSSLCEGTGSNKCGTVKTRAFATAVACGLFALGKHQAAAGVPGKQEVAKLQQAGMMSQQASVEQQRQQQARKQEHQHQHHQQQKQQQAASMEQQPLGIKQQQLSFCFAKFLKILRGQKKHKLYTFKEKELKGDPLRYTFSECWCPGWLGSNGHWTVDLDGEKMNRPGIQNWLARPGSTGDLKLSLPWNIK
eukprot:308946-Pelagomonas_calceolata.AAC.7